MASNSSIIFSYSESISVCWRDIVVSTPSSSSSFSEWAELAVVESVSILLLFGDTD